MNALLVVYVSGIVLFAAFAAGRVAERERMRLSVAIAAVTIFAVLWPVMLVAGMLGSVLVARR